MSRRKLLMTVEITEGMIMAAARANRRHQDPVYLEIRRLLPKRISTRIKTESLLLFYTNSETGALESNVVETFFPKEVQQYRTTFFENLRRNSVYSWRGHLPPVSPATFKLRLSMPRLRKQTYA